MKRAVVIFALAFLSLTVYAKPVYLKCSVSSDKETKSFHSKLDEDSGKITHTNTKGGAFNTEGFFSANTISYQNIILVSELRVTFKYEIDRTDLSITETFVTEPINPKFAAKIPAKTIRMNGICEIEQIKERKI